MAEMVKIDLLRELSDLDGELSRLSKEGARFPAEAVAIDARLKKARQATALRQKALEDVDAHLASIVESIEGEKEKIRVAEEELVTKETMDEYTRAARAIDILRKSLDEMENSRANVNEERKHAETLVEEALACEAAEARTVTSQKAANTREQKKHDALVAERLQCRGQVAERLGALDAALLKRYELAHRMAGNGLAEVTPAGSCSGCNMRLRPQTYSQVRGSGIGECPTCHRLLRWVEPPPPPPAKVVLSTDDSAGEGEKKPRGRKKKA